MSDRPKIGLLSAASCVVGGIIGVGIFFTPSSIAAVVPDERAAMAVWVAGAVLVALGAFAYAELAALYPRTGGVYVFLREAYGRLPAFLYAWMCLLVISTGALAVIAVVAGQQLVYLFPGLGEKSVPWLGAGIVLLHTVANSRGIRVGAAVQVLTVSLKVAAILLIVGAAFAAPAAAPVGPGGAPGPWTWAAFGAGLIPVLFSYGGWQNVTFIGGEVKDPERNLPRSIFLGVGLVCLVYLLVNWAYFRLLSFEGVAGAKALAAEAARKGFGGVGGSLVASALFVSAFGITNSISFTYPRLYVAMAEDGLFFRSVARCQPRTGAPAAAIWIQGLWAILLLLTLGMGGLDPLTSGVVFADWIFFALCGAALWVLRVRRPELPRPYRAPLAPLVSAGFTAAALFAVFAAVEKNPRETLYGLEVMVVGVVVFLLWNVKKALSPP